MEPAWKQFIEKVQKMARHPMKEDAAATFFAELLPQKDGEPLLKSVKREREAIMALFWSAPGQDLIGAQQTLWGAVNAVTYYADHVRSGGTAERLDSAWFGTGYAMKEKAWNQANAWVT